MYLFFLEPRHYFFLQHRLVDMKQATTIFIVMLLGSTFVQAQSYITAGGIRVGSGIGLTLQQRLTKRITVEGIIQTQSKRDEVMATALVQRHFPIITKHFNIYGGAGIHKGWSTTSIRNEVDYTNPFGVTFVGGIEMTLGRVNLAYDFKPALNLSGGTQFLYPQSAVSVRYVFIKDKIFDKKKKKKKKKNQNESFNWKFWED